MKDDVQKLEFTIKALAMDDPFANDLAMHDDIWECLAWQKGRSAEEIMCERESATQLIEGNGSWYWQSGKCAEWFVGADPDVAYIAREVNGPLCEELAARCFVASVPFVCFAYFSHSGVSMMIWRFPSCFARVGPSMVSCNRVAWVVLWMVQLLWAMWAPCSATGCGVTASLHHM